MCILSLSQVLNESLQWRKAGFTRQDLPDFRYVYSVLQTWMLPLRIRKVGKNRESNGNKNERHFLQNDLKGWESSASRQYENSIPHKLFKTKQSPKYKQNFLHRKKPKIQTNNNTQHCPSQFLFKIIYSEAAEAFHLMDFPITSVKRLILAPYLAQTFPKFTQGSRCIPSLHSAAPSCGISSLSQYPSMRKRRHWANTSGCGTNPGDKVRAYP